MTRPLIEPGFLNRLLMPFGHVFTMSRGDIPRRIVHVIEARVKMVHDDAESCLHRVIGHWPLTERLDAIAYVPDARLAHPHLAGRIVMRTCACPSESCVPPGTDQAFRRRIPGRRYVTATLVINGLVVLPKVAAGGLTGEGSHEARGAGLTDQEVRWLKALAGGITVAQLARDARYSERSMYRRLSVLYRRLNVRNRTQALLAASERRLLC